MGKTTTKPPPAATQAEDDPIWGDIFGDLFGHRRPRPADDTAETSASAPVPKRKAAARPKKPARKVKEK